MAVCTYKDGVMELVAPEHLAGQLEAGWSLEDPDAEVVEDDPEGGGKLSTEEMVAIANENGIEGAEDMHYQTLKKTLADAELI